jgi:lysophospholipid acyltransferase (LPLAT)-like uncharacterized protein
MQKSKLLLLHSPKLVHYWHNKHAMCTITRSKALSNKIQKIIFNSQADGPGSGLVLKMQDVNGCGQKLFPFVWMRTMKTGGHQRL